MKPFKFNPDIVKQMVSHYPVGGAAPAPGESLLPKISIITPSYNQGDYLERTILSVLNQNYPNLEYIVIDGGSTDQSVSIIKKYEKFIAYWVSEKDSGQAEALNKGFARATGELVGWQNSDDVYLPDAFAKAAAVFSNRPDVDVAFSDRLDIDAYDNVIGETRFTPFSQLAYWYDGMSLSNQSAFWKRSVFKDVGLLDCQFQLAMDYEFFLRVSLRGKKFLYVKDYLGAIRRHSQTKTSNLFSSRLGAEHAKMDAIHGRKNGFNWLFKTMALCYRGFFYAMQGDFDYLVRGVRRRLVG